MEVGPSMSSIGEWQNRDRPLRSQFAKAHYYGAANLWHVVGSSLSITFALAAPIVFLSSPKQGPLLGAFAGIWIFITRLLFDPIQRHYQAKGAVAQELFDCEVLGLGWNAALAPRPADEEIRSASRAFEKSSSTMKHRNWYPTDAMLAWPISVLTCQRSNAVWARRQHNAYAILLLVLVASCGSFGIVLATYREAKLVEYLTTLAMPSLPAMLDGVEVARRQFRASASRLQFEQQIDRLLEDVVSVDLESMRKLQDQIFALRRDAPPVAGWFYKVLRPKYEADMRYAAAQRTTEGRA